MHTLVGWSESQDTGGVLTLVAGLQDTSVRVVGDDIVVPELDKLIGAIAFGLNLTQAQLQSPSLRRLANQDLRPGIAAALTGARPGFLDYRRHPRQLVRDEALNALVAEDNAGAVRDNVLAWLSDGDYGIPDGEMFSLRVTGAITAVANAWTSGALTFAQALPAGKYALVGARGEGTSMQAFRFLFTGHPWRPGGIGNAAIGEYEREEVFRYGGLGVWGEFLHNTPPNVEILCNAADTAQTFHLDLVQTAG